MMYHGFRLACGTRRPAGPHSGRTGLRGFTCCRVLDLPDGHRAHASAVPRLPVSHELTLQVGSERRGNRAAIRQELRKHA